MSSPVFDSKYTTCFEAETPTGTLYYCIYYDFDELSEEALINYIDITLPDGMVIPLPPAKYKELYYLEEQNIGKQLLY